MERMLGRDREALAHFKTVVNEVPRHAEALAEIRMLEARLPKKK
jgi:predicted metal-dependent enzyme (double-stranded beta helix superfamily)